MRPASVGWERAAEVRGAAEGWHRANAIDAATLERVRDAYPDPCVTPSPVWRALTAAVVSAIALCLFGGLALATQSDGAGIKLLLLAFAGAAIAATEMLEARPSLARRGAAGATAFWAVAFLLAALFVLLADRHRLDDAIDGTFAAGAVAWAAACWRWGHPVFAGLSAVALFAFLARLPAGRLSWVVAGAALAALATPRLDHAPWAPSHRRAAAVLLLAGLAAGYAAVNAYSIDQRSIEHLSRAGARWGTQPAGLLLAAAIATAAFPVAVLWWGLRSRRTLLIDAGLVLALLSAATLRHFVHLAPLWTVLVLAGAAIVALAMALERALVRAPAGEIRGFTAAPLYSDERRRLALEVIPAVTTFTPAGPAPAPPDKPLGAGGQFGGGGTTERF
jgi:hypothetical protein